MMLSSSGPNSNNNSNVPQGPNSQQSTMMNALSGQIAHMNLNATAGGSVNSTAVSSSSSASTPAPGSNSGLNTPLAGLMPGQVVVQGSLSQTKENERILQLIEDLLSYETREQALMELSRKRENVEDLAVLLWNSFGAIAALLQEIISVYPTIHPPTLNAHQSNRVCNALALLQCVASHNQTRAVFLQANIPLFLYPFLNMTTTSKTRPFEYLRLTSLGVIGALVKTDEREVINFLLKTEIIPLCLRIMESGSELSKTVATFILQKILLDETGLNYICQTYERFSHVAMILGKMVLALAKDHSQRLLKHVIRCYLRLSDNPRAREALKQCLPDYLKNNTFANTLNSDRPTKHWLMQLLKNIETKDQNQQAQSGQPGPVQPPTTQPTGPNGTGGGQLTIGPAPSPGIQTVATSVGGGPQLMQPTGGAVVGGGGGSSQMTPTTSKIK